MVDHSVVHLNVSEPKDPITNQYRWKEEKRIEIGV